MATSNLSEFIRQVAVTVEVKSLADSTDRQLVASALSEQSGAAFTTIVHRHGHMVYGVCVRVSRNPQDAEDAFQATFLVLARKLHSVRKHDSLASWLHGVARRVALKAKSKAISRERREMKVAPAVAFEAGEATTEDVSSALDFELSRLPDKWRLPLILCFLEGRTQEESANQLGWSKSTLRRRLEEARTALMNRLQGRGIASAAVLASVIVSDQLVSASPPASLVAGTAQSASAILAGKGFAAVASPNVVSLIEGVLQAMFRTTLAKSAAIILIATGTAVGIGGLSTAALAIGKAGNPTAPTSPQSVALPVAANEDKKAGETTDGKKAQGAWKVFSVAYPQGSKLSEEHLKEWSLDIQGDAWNGVEHMGRKQKWVYKIDETKSPKEIDFTFKNTTGKTVTLKGIYELNEDTLKVCWTVSQSPKAPRPTEFNPEKATLAVYKRAVKE